MSDAPNGDRTRATWDAIARILVGEPELTPTEVSRDAGVDLALARSLWRALGFPPVADDQRLFSRTDAATLRAVHDVMARGDAGPETVLQLARVIGQAAARIAEAEVGLLQPSADPAARADVVPELERFLAYVWRRHLLAALLRALAAQGTAAGPRVVVGFADLVGFTELAQQLDGPELADLVQRFETCAYEHIPGRGGRLVKTIGDEVMFAVDAPRTAAEIALALVEAYARDDVLPDVRIGLAWGTIVAYEGDLFGPTVNLASRLVKLARPRSVLVSDELGTALAEPGTFRLHPLRARLHGIGRTRAWVLRAASSDADARSAGPRARTR